MSRTLRVLPIFLLAALALGQWLVVPAAAQVLVYRMAIEPIQSVNLDFYTGGYFVVPADGGEGSFIFTKKGKGEKAFVTTGTGTLFTGVTENGVRKSVVRATNGSSGEAKSSYMAYGSADQMTRLSTPEIYYYTEIAPKLIGQALASSTGSDPETPKEIGFTGIFEWRLAWDKKQTDSANKAGNTVAETITSLETMLKDQGYNAEDTPALAITTASPLTSAAVGTAYSTTLGATGGSGARTWSVSLGTPPAGLSLSPSGILSGTPSATGSETFTVKVTDSSGASATKVFSLSVGSAALAITSTSPLDSGTVGTPYSQTLQATGGTGSKTWELLLGDLPGGLSLLPGGLIAGSPTTAGSYTFTVKVTDAAPTSATKAFTIVVTNP
jgi:hypothetical protein